jgi:protein gp37
MGKTSIEWTDASWNPIVGCTEVSPGCANCYAARLAATRLSGVPAYKDLAILNNGKPRWLGNVAFLAERLEEPLHWRKPRRIFVCDMGDLFHESVDNELIDAVFGVMARCGQHTFQVLTKRPQRMQEFFSRPRTYSRIAWPFCHVWLGVSVENQRFADERIPLLLQTPAAVRFISAEPLLGQVELWRSCPPAKDGRWAIKQLDWVIAGGESGPHARPMHPDWARSLRDQCQAAGVPFFFKQWGAWAPWSDHFGKYPSRAKMRAWGNEEESLESAVIKVGKRAAGRTLDGREWNEFPGV